MQQVQSRRCNVLSRCFRHPGPRTLAADPLRLPARGSGAVAFRPDVCVFWFPTFMMVAGCPNTWLARACAVGGDRQAAPGAVQPAAACTAAHQHQTARLRSGTYDCASSAPQNTVACTRLAPASLTPYCDACDTLVVAATRSSALSSMLRAELGGRGSVAAGPVQPGGGRDQQRVGAPAPHDHVRHPCPQQSCRVLLPGKFLLRRASRHILSDPPAVGCQ